MGSGVWFKNIISKKKVKGDKSQKSQKSSAPENKTGQEKASLVQPSVGPTHGRDIRSVEDAAATKIQTAYRAYTARKRFHRLRAGARLQNLVKRDNVKKQATNSLTHMQSWIRIQAQIRARRVHMVNEGRLRQRKLENQLKLEAKLQDLEVEWSAGPDTADEALARIHQREAAAVKRERAMAYAFTHQWRANSIPSFGSANNELSKENWGWSWMDRWIAARPWESRVAESPKKTSNLQIKKTFVKNNISPSNKAPDKAKLISPNGKATRKARKLSYEGAGKITAKKVIPNADEKKSIQ